MKRIKEMRWWNTIGVVGVVSGTGFTLWLAAKRNADVLPVAERYFRVTGEVLIVAGLAFGLAFIILQAWSYTSGRLHEADRLRVEYKKLHDAQAWRDLDRMAGYVARSKTLWGTPCQDNPVACTYEDDPVFLQIAVDTSLRKVLSQPIVQRLNHIRQLSFAYLIFGSATHTRLAHSLGACRNAELVMRRVLQEDRLYTQNGAESIGLSDSRKKELIRLARFAALLHDLGHGPLSHALETHIGVSMGAKKPAKPDKELSIKYIDKYLSQILRDEGVNPEDLTGVIQENRLNLSPWLHFIADLIDSPLDVDRMDYLVRDAHMSGLSIGGLNIQALIERAVPFEEVEREGKRIELAFDSSALPYVEQFLYARDVMYLNCYEHRRKVCAESMLGRAFQDLMSASSGRPGVTAEELAFMTDQEFMQLLLECSGASTTSFRMAEMLMRGVTFELVKEFSIEINLRDPNNPDPSAFEKLPPQIRIWADAAMGEDYASAYLITPERWAMDIARRSGVDQSQILVTVPSLSIVDKWAKEGEIRLLKEDPDGGYSVSYVKDLPNTIWKNFVGALAGARLKVRVFAHPDLSDQQRKHIRDVSVAFFNGRQV
jgi:HD superfamily phosphohydrolase